MTEKKEVEAVFRNEKVASAMINSFGALVTFFYLNVIDLAPSAEESLRPLHSLDAILFSVIFGTFFFGGISLGNQLKKNFKYWALCIEAGETTPADVPEKIRRGVINFPLYAASIAVLMWTSSSIIAGYLTQSIRIFMGLFIWGGGVSAILLFFVDDLLWKPVIQTFFPQGNLSAIHAFRLPVFLKLLIAFFFTGVIPPSLLLFLTRQRTKGLLFAPNPEVILANLQVLQVFIWVAGITASVVLAFFITHGITNPLQSLRAAMADIQKGDLAIKVPVTTNDELGYLGEYFNQMTAGLRQKEMLRNLLNIYVSPEVAQEALTHGTQLGGELIECTVLFSDIRDFTSISESLPPNELMTLLNRYMSMMVEVIVENRGMVNKFGGDSLLAIFGTPLNPAENHAAQAVRSAEEMFSALHKFNQQVDTPALRIGVGIATGKVVAGNIGGRERIEYTVIGDTVNLASRLEDKTKEIAGNTLMSEECYRQASAHLSLQAEFLSEIRVKGKREPLGAYAMDIKSSVPFQAS